MSKKWEAVQIFMQVYVLTNHNPTKTDKYKKTYTCIDNFSTKTQIYVR